MTGLLLMQRKLLRNLFLLKLKRQMPGQKGEVQLVSYITSTFFRRIIPKLLQPAREGVYQVFKFDLVAELAMLDNNIVVYQFIQDLHFFVTGGDDENELILSAVLQGFFDAVGLLLRSNVDKREALENLDLILLCLDEIVDGGMVLETDANVIAGKVASHSIDAAAPLSEQTLTQALATAREHLKRSLLK